MKEREEPEVILEKEDLLVHQEHPVLGENPECQDLMALLEKLGLKVHLVTKDPLVLLDYLVNVVHLDQLEIKEEEAILDYLDPKDQLEKLETVDLKELLGLLDRLVKLEAREILDRLDLLVNLEQLV